LVVSFNLDKQKTKRVYNTDEEIRQGFSIRGISTSTLC